MTYVLIFSADNGATWCVMDSSDDRDAMFTQCSALQRRHPEIRYEVKCLDARLWNALQPITIP